MPTPSALRPAQAGHASYNTMSKIEKECPCCGAIYIVTFVQPDSEEQDWSIEEETFDDELNDIEPEFCPFCGSHEDDEPDEEILGEDN